MKPFTAITASTFVIHRHFLDGLSLPIFIKDLSGKYVYCNHPFGQFLGKSIEEVIGLTDPDIKPSKMGAIYTKAHEELFALDKMQSDHLIANGSFAQEKVVFKKAPLCNANNQLIGWIGSISTEKFLLRNSMMGSSKMTPRENEVLSLLSRGFSVKNMAVQLNISHHTVSHHLKEIYAKLGAHSKNEALFKAFSLPQS